jgi:hypothetical protein
MIFLKENLNKNNYYFKTSDSHNLPYLGNITSDSPTFIMQN